MHRSPAPDAFGSIPAQAAPTGAVPPDLTDAVERHGDGLGDYCLMWLGEATAVAVAETIRATLLLAADRRALPSGQGEARAWLYAVARARCLSRPAGGTAFAAGPPPRPETPDATDPAVAGLRVLDRRQREMLELSFRHGLDHAEIAAVTGQGVERVASTLTEAQDVFEAWVNVVMLTRAARAKCAEGSELAAAWSTRPGRGARTRLRVHVTGCATCAKPANLTVDAATLLGRIPRKPLSAGQRAYICDPSLPAPTDTVVEWGADGFPVQPDGERPAAVPPLRAPVLAAGLEANRTADFWDADDTDADDTDADGNAADEAGEREADTEFWGEERRRGRSFPAVRRAFRGPLRPRLRRGRGFGDDLEKFEELDGEPEASPRGGPTDVFPSFGTFHNGLAGVRNDPGRFGGADESGPSRGAAPAPRAGDDFDLAVAEGERRRSGKGLAITTGVVLTGGLLWTVFNPTSQPITLDVAHEVTAPAGTGPELSPTPVPAPAGSLPEEIPLDPAPEGGVDATPGVVPTGSGYGATSGTGDTPEAGATSGTGGTPEAGATSGTGGAPYGGSGGAPDAGATPGSGTPEAGATSGAGQAPGGGTTVTPGTGPTTDPGADATARPDGAASATPGDGGEANPGDGGKAAPTVIPGTNPSGEPEATPTGRAGSPPRGLPSPTATRGRPAASPSDRAGSGRPKDPSPSPSSKATGGGAAASPVTLVASEGTGGDGRSEIILLRAVGGTVAWRAGVSTPLLQLSSSRGTVGQGGRDGFQVRLTPLNTLAAQGRQTLNHLYLNCGRTRTATLRVAWTGISRSGARAQGVIPLRVTFRRPCP